MSSFSMLSNVPAMTAQRNLARTQHALAGSVAKLSSGLRIRQAADDAAGLAISSRLDADVRGYAQAERNANDGISMIQIAEGAMNEQQGILTRLRELAIQAGNGALGDDERGFLDTERDQLVQELDRISAATEFNGFAMLGADAGAFAMQVGVNAVAGTDTIDVAFDATDSVTLGVDALDFTTAATAQASLADIDAAIDALSTSRATLGSSQNRLQVTVENLRTSQESVTEAASRIRDVDVARETASLARHQIMSQAGAAMLAQANQLPSLALSLIG